MTHAIRIVDIKQSGRWTSYGVPSTMTLGHLLMAIIKSKFISLIDVFGDEEMLFTQNIEAVKMKHPLDKDDESVVKYMKGELEQESSPDEDEVNKKEVH